MINDERYEKFLSVLFEGANGDAERAKVMAGFDKEEPLGPILKTLEKRIPELTKTFLSTKGQIAAVWALVHALKSPTDLGTKEKLAAAKEILDRTGLTKTEKIEVESKSPLFILPAKRDEDEDADY